MRDFAKPIKGKIINFQFFGGERDGQIVGSDQPLDDVNEANILWALTRMGTINRHFETPCNDGKGRRERYRVVSKQEADDEIYVTCEYVNKA